MRRILLLVVLLTAVGVAAMKLRARATPATALDVPTWPPITPRADPVTTPGPPPAAATPPAPGSDRAWKPVNPNGSMPDGYAIKANSQSMIFHVPGGRFYDRTKPERCYATEVAAEADGYRRSKS